jgi:membrane-bound lytic murein transglycosylase D
MTLPPLDPEIRTDEVMVNKQVELKTIASTLQMDHDLLEELNAELRLNMTPGTPYPLKVPEGRGQVLLAKLNDLPAYCPPPAGVASSSSYIIHKVTKGETIASIGRKYRTSPEVIMDVNGFKKNEILAAGWKIKVPTNAGSPQAKGTKASALVVAKEEKPTKYVVKKGDSIWQIAGRYNTTAKEIQALNRLKGPSLHTGQLLLIPPTPASCAVVQTKHYTVKGGETPFMIAKRHEMEISDFLKINNLTPHSTIFPGQTVLVKAN